MHANAAFKHGPDVLYGAWVALRTPLILLALTGCGSTWVSLVAAYAPSLGALLLSGAIVIPFPLSCHKHDRGCTSSPNKTQHCLGSSPPPKFADPAAAAAAHGALRAAGLLQDLTSWQADAVDEMNYERRLEGYKALSSTHWADLGRRKVGRGPALLLLFVCVN